MTDAINGNKRPYNQTLSNPSSTKPASDGAASGKQSTGASSASTVSLNSANLLQDIQQQIDQIPDVNSSKVESIKQAISNGEYQVDASVIAKKFIEIEKLLP